MSLPLLIAIMIVCIWAAIEVAWIVIQGVLILLLWLYTLALDLLRWLGCDW